MNRGAFKAPLIFFEKFLKLIKLKQFLKNFKTTRGYNELVK